MGTKSLLDSGSPVTQSIEAVAALLSWRKMPTSPMPDHIELLGKVFLVLSGKRDVYYTTTQQACSCPWQVYNPSKRCKHQRKFFKGELEQDQEPKSSDRSQSMAEVLAEHDKNLDSMPANYRRMVKAAREETDEDPDSIRPKGKWAGGFSGPVDPNF
jgi:hypothetical protein